MCRLSVRELGERLDVDRNEIQRAIDANRAHWDDAIKDLES
jgi:hypothetical protein